MTLTGDTHCQPHLKRIAFWQERILVNSRGNFQAEPLMSLLCVSANLSEDSSIPTETEVSTRPTSKVGTLG